MIYSIILLLAGIGIGQEFNNVLPSVKMLATNAFIYLQQKIQEQKQLENELKEQQELQGNFVYEFFFKK